MIRTIIKIDEDLCNGCGECIKGCHENALQLVNGKAKIVSESYCDGLGACIGECPVGAIELIERECEAFNAEAVEAFKCIKEKESNHKGFAYGEESVKLNQWPLQLHLANPVSNHFQGSDFLLAADCTAFSVQGFHNKFLRNKSIAIACPKLDSNISTYIEKLRVMIDDSHLNTISVLMMEVPCCGGLLMIVNKAKELAKRNIPVKKTIISTKGEIISETWI